ncbi:tripartite tricarboxylate transporter TctB family protein [Paracoccus pantotrophus]|uniref:tripartite tricarboxylate transporter TctB family protein n=1 Tax=Paracoccus pantotrophus TaxID=82367 RepID=UPI0004914555|nr:tripartite tricarboxylate transporter TctB family protein [Paracoccus pantotrophus]
MQKRDFRDIVGGAILLLIGGYAAISSLAGLSIGTVGRMGPGMFPTIIGVFIAIMGLLVMVPAFFRSGQPISFDLRSTSMILLSILVFGLAIRPLGLVPAVIALTVVASLADGMRSWSSTAVLCAVLCTLATLIFKLGFGLQVPIANWPW